MTKYPKQQQMEVKFYLYACKYIKLQEKILKLHQPYRPAGPEDAILDLPIKLAAQNEVTASVIEALAGNTQTD